MPERKRMRQFLSAQILSLILTLTLCLFAGTACTGSDDGDDDDNGGGGGGGSVAIATVGIDNCAGCHSGNISAWMTSAHGNAEDIDLGGTIQNDGADSLGYPYYDMLDGLPTCGQCHDELGDGQILTPDRLGNSPRPVVGCESCHGGGEDHLLVPGGQVEFPAPGPEQCAKCHDAGLCPSPGGGDDGIYTEYLESKHANSINTHMTDHALPAGQVEYRALCTRCHTSDGYRELLPQLPGDTRRLELVGSFTGVPNLLPEEISPVGCASCHGSAPSRDQITRIAPTVVAGETQSSEYNTCTSCHQLSGNDGLVIPPGTNGVYHDPANPHNSAAFVINDTHAAVPGDVRLSTGAGAQALFFVKKADANACSVCHDPHAANAEINLQYAQSGHGNPLGTAFTAHDFKQTFGTMHAGTGMRKCQRCHTSTAFRNFADALENNTVYDNTANDFSYLLGVDDNLPIDLTNDQNESVYCWACHSDNEGGLRKIGGFRHLWPDQNGGPLYYPDLGGSNLCVSCHAGYYPAGQINSSTADFSNLMFIGPHYLDSAAILLNSAYEYTGRSYAAAGFQHQNIGQVLFGSTELIANGANGPCAGCHMTSTAEPHKFAALERDGDTVSVLSQGCVACHPAGEVTGDFLDGKKAALAESLEALRLVMNSRGFWFNVRHPNWWTDASATVQQKNWITGGDPATAKPNMGAAYNYMALLSDPGAHVHNSIYARRLIYDSIDWMDDSTLNNSTATTVSALGTQVDQAVVGDYLLGGSGTRP